MILLEASGWYHFYDRFITGVGMQELRGILDGLKTELAKRSVYRDKLTAEYRTNERRLIEVRGNIRLIERLLADDGKDNVSG